MNSYFINFSKYATLMKDTYREKCGIYVGTLYTLLFLC